MKPLSQDSNYRLQDKSAPVISHNCPRCGHGKSWSSTLRSSDNLLQILFYTPYRCRACMSRFWKLHSSFRLNVFIATIILLVSVLGFYATAAFQKSPTEQLADTTEDHKIKQRAQEGDADAALQVGMSFIGNSAHKNYKEAVKWLAQSARNNNTDAQYYYGLSLLGGRGVIQDYKAGFFWIEKAARKGHPEAQFSLGKMYRRGTGVEIDRARAYLWFNLAAAQGIEDAARNRDSIANHLALPEVIAMQEEAYRIDIYDNANLTENSITVSPASMALQQ
ncbi:hypothetical protein [Crenothrix sp.]|uniref:hypothetical protein n=1 Tax=Crenothrix sp. TaxID=3100433 RepID=UPI00374DD8FA